MQSHAVPLAFEFDGRYYTLEVEHQK